MGSDPSDPVPASEGHEEIEPGLGTTRPPDGPPEALREEIGPYRLLQVIGEGGMGVIYKAEQRGTLRRTVALKVIKLGMDTRAVIARFDAERQALAMMNHPNIARVFDAGSTPLGRPYFAMEYVPGEPITAYCDRHKLPIRQRLELFMKVCDAVQHAHTKGVIHRDLKAGNVLVAVQDGKPVPKVIDFGVAKAINQRLTEQTLFTETGRMIGTPGYMSPEQAEGGADVDTRSDVYSLGVLLYELLTGSLPFDPARLRELAYNEVQRIIREVDPPRPSTFYSHASEASRTAAQRRAATVEQLANALRHELEWIPLMAMRKERTSRYESAAQLGRDIGNYLAGLPLIAAPDSRTYRLRKVVRRNSRAFAAAAVVLLALLLGIAGTSWQALRAGRAERLAQQRALAAEDRAARHRATARFLYSVFDGLDPSISQGRDTSLLLELLATAESRIDKDLPHPAARAGYLHFLGDLYSRFGDSERAAPLLESGVALSREALADALAAGTAADYDYEAVRSLAEGCQRYSRFRTQLGEHEAAEALAREAYTAVSLHLPEDHAEWVFAEARLGRSLQNLGRLEEAEPLTRSALERMQRRPELFSGEQRGVAAGMLADLLLRRGDLEQAEATYRQAAGMFGEAGALRTSEYAELLTNWAKVALAQKDVAMAQKRLDEAAAIREAIFSSPDHPARVEEWDLRSAVLGLAGDPAGAAEALLRAVNIMQAASHDSEKLGDAASRLAAFLREAGDEAAAAEWEQRSREYSGK